jgi:hypothetical protein
MIRKEVKNMADTNTELNKVIEAASAAIDAAATNGAVKPVALAKIVGVREQLIYNYLSSGRINGFRNAGQYHRIDAEVAKTWAAGYLTRKYTRDS